MKQVSILNQRPEPIPLTEAAFTQLKTDKKKYLKEEAEVLVRIQKAREMGDLSENGAYKYGKFELGRIRRELKRINYLLRWGKIVKADQIGKAEFGTTVTLESAGKHITYQLVSQHESNPLEHKLAITSPLGSLLLGKSVGASVELDAPAGKVTYTIIKISLD